MGMRRLRWVPRWGVVGRASRPLAVAALIGLVTVQPYAAPVAYGQAIPQVICGIQASGEPQPIGAPNAEGWTKEENLPAANESRRYLFNVKEKGTAYVYVGDQWYNLDLGVFSVVFGAESCWSLRLSGVSDESQRRVINFVKPDERSLDVEPGDYILTVRPGDLADFDPRRNFTVRVAVSPRACALNPANIPTEYPGLTQKPDNPNLFQIGASITPDESKLGPFALMAFNAYVSPPFTDLFDFTWELDGQVVPGENGPTFLKPYADLKKTGGAHTLKMTAKGAREYHDPTDATFNFTPFDGGAQSVTCTFTGPA